MREGLRPRDQGAGSPNGLFRASRHSGEIGEGAGGAHPRQSRQVHVSPPPASARRRISRANCSSSPSGSICAGAVCRRRALDPVGSWRGTRPCASRQFPRPTALVKDGKAARARRDRGDALAGAARRAHPQRTPVSRGRRPRPCKASWCRPARRSRSSISCSRRSRASSRCPK